MSAHEHSLSCLKTAGHVLYCEVTGDVGLELPKPKAAPILTSIPTPTPSLAISPTADDWRARELRIVTGDPRVLGTKAQANENRRYKIRLGKRPAVTTLSSTATRANFTILGPDEGTRFGGSLAYPYSLSTFEGAKAKALELLARKTRTPYLTVNSYVPGEKTTRIKIERSALGADPEAHYAFYPGHARDAAVEAQTLPAIKKLAEAHLKEHPEKSDVLIYAITPGRGSPMGKQISKVHQPVSATGDVPKDLSRANTIRLIREGLKKRSGKDWSVTGGSGTAYGWLKISSPPSRRVNNYMTDADAKELGRLLGSDKPAHMQGESVAASSAHYTEYIDRAWGRTPTKYGEQYWD
jgi:hypothetical protein